MIISIEGNIGSGKTKQLQLLKDKGYTVIEENVESWKEEGWLERFYKNPYRTALGFQMRVLYDHLDRNNHITKPLTIIERSAYTCIEVFGKILLEDKMMTEQDINLMRMYFEANKFLPDVFIYIQTLPKVAYERVRKRDRTGEELIDCLYLEKLHHHHELSFIENKSLKIFIVDGNKSIEEVQDAIVKIIENLTSS